MNSLYCIKIENGFVTILFIRDFIAIKAFYFIKINLVMAGITY